MPGGVLENVPLKRRCATPVARQRISRVESVFFGVLKRRHDTHLSRTKESRLQRCSLGFSCTKVGAKWWGALSALRWVVPVDAEMRRWASPRSALCGCEKDESSPRPGCCWPAKEEEEEREAVAQRHGGGRHGGGA